MRTASRKKTTKPRGTAAKLLSGGNPRVPKADGGPMLVVDIKDWLGWAYSDLSGGSRGWRPWRGWPWRRS